MPPAKKARTDTNFPEIGEIKYEGPESTNPLAFKYYNADEVILGKKMSEWCRFAVCYWHTFCGPGADPFGEATLQRPWYGGNDPLALAELKLDVAFEF